VIVVWASGLEPVVRVGGVVEITPSGRLYNQCSKTSRNYVTQDCTFIYRTIYTQAYHSPEITELTSRHQLTDIQQRGTENAGVENAIRSKMQGWKLQE